jgi:adenylate kinase
MKLLIMGPPGAGKGTQATRIASFCEIPHISTGDIFRGAVQAGSELGKQLKGYLDNGQLVPDQVTIAVIRQRLEQSDCKPGFLLDGFPRTLPQAEALDRLIVEMGSRIDVVLNIAVAPESLLERLTGRRICRKCGAPYHIKFQPPKVTGVCDRCGSELYQRSDDTAATVSDRIHVYEGQTAPLLDYYRKQSLLQEIEGELSVDQVWNKIETILRSLKG